MAITDKTAGVWGLDQVYKKSNQDIWKYSSYPKQMMAWGRRWPSGNSLGTYPSPAGNVSLSSPVQVGSALPGGDIWQAISKNSINGGNGTGFATKTDGTLWSWGANGYGQLGLNQHNIHQSSPTQLPGTWKTGFAEFAGHRDYGVALQDL